MNHLQKHFSASLIALAALLTAPLQGAWAATAPSLGTAASFGALGGTGVTCTSPIPALPAITVAGNVGSLLTAPSSVTGFPPDSPPLCSLSGTVQLGATAAYADFMTAYTAIDTNNPCPVDAAHNLSGDLGGMTLSPGLYCISGVGLLSSQLTLDGGGNANAVWIFKAASSITAIGGSVVMANGGNACNVYWRTGTLVSLDNTQFVGNILAGTAITFTTPISSLTGSALAQTDVTMTGASITACSATVGGGGNNGGGNNGGGNGNGGDNGNGNGNNGGKNHHSKDHEGSSNNPFESSDNHNSSKDHGSDS